MKKLVHVDPDLYLHPKVAVVGSSALLARGKYGTEIDSYQDILRFNRAPTIGFEQIAGSRTTLRLVNNHVFKNLKFTRWVEDNNFVKNLRNSRLLVSPTEPNLYKKTHNTDSSNVVHGILSTFTSEAAAVYSTVYSGKIPTVGTMGILLLIMSGIRPIVYGWSVKPTDPMSHYYNSRSPQGSNYHKFADEVKLLLKLEKDNLLEFKR